MTVNIRLSDWLARPVETRMQTQSPQKRADHREHGRSEFPADTARFVPQHTYAVRPWRSFLPDQVCPANWLSRICCRMGLRI